jgi:hypothetical protein
MRSGPANLPILAERNSDIHAGRYELAARPPGMTEADFARTRISLRKPLLDAYSAMLLDDRAMIGGDRFAAAATAASARIR